MILADIRQMPGNSGYSDQFRLLSIHFHFSDLIEYPHLRRISCYSSYNFIRLHTAVEDTVYPSKDGAGDAGRSVIVIGVGRPATIYSRGTLWTRQSEKKHVILLSDLLYQKRCMGIGDIITTNFIFSRCALLLSLHLSPS